MPQLYPFFYCTFMVILDSRHLTHGEAAPFKR